MKTTQSTAIKAHNVLMQMNNKLINSTLAFKLFRLKKAVDPIVEFRMEQERKIIDELGGMVVENGHSVHFEDKEQGRKFVQMRDELDNMECDVEIEKQTVSLEAIPEITIADIDALSEFIDWTE